MQSGTDVLLLNASPPYYNQEDNRLVYYIGRNSGFEAKGPACTLFYPVVKDRDSGKYYYCQVEGLPKTQTVTILKEIPRPDIDPVRILDAVPKPTCTGKHLCNKIIHPCKPSCEICGGRGGVILCKYCVRPENPRHVCPICYRACHSITGDNASSSHFTNLHGFPLGAWPGPTIIARFRVRSPLPDPMPLLKMRNVTISVSQFVSSSKLQPLAPPAPREDAQSASETHESVPRRDEPS